jgi:hypothetical protein
VNEYRGKGTIMSESNTSILQNWTGTVVEALRYPFKDSSILVEIPKLELLRSSRKLDSISLKETRKARGSQKWDIV